LNELVNENEGMKDGVLHDERLRIENRCLQIDFDNQLEKEKERELTVWFCYAGRTARMPESFGYDVP
jgi:hypothetical protein